MEHVVGFTIVGPEKGGNLLPKSLGDGLAKGHQSLPPGSKGKNGCHSHAKGIVGFHSGLILGCPRLKRDRFVVL
jgi:hypothetical protein